ncbi:hypothetical protein A9Q84_16195 [Halobacteriovorax marinus]|uniref:Periplasmic binding protein domain-containing protein n=1 Tax=Halobacteriovorax marinus TaxID=97084 RepID=A0A1Y5F480_9BACT|nr:hypothetical protein A9Q84_16195 [Halobacteriovorax marinus]
MKLTALTTLFLISFCSLAVDKVYRFGVVTKESQLPFFQAIKKGCVTRARELKNVECLFADISEASARLQEQAIKNFILKEKIDGLAVAVINADFLQRSLSKFVPKHVPVITVDADFSEDILKGKPSIRAAYVGTDNYALGFQLGELYKKSTTTKSEFCIISGHRYTDNLNQRIKGFLSSVNKSKGDLYSQNPRCPLYSLENSKNSLKQMDHMLSLGVSKKVIPSIILMGGWPQLIPNQYKKVMGKYKSLMQDKLVSVYSIDALPVQIDLLVNGLSQGNVGQMPVEMGREVINVLHDIVRNKNVKQINSTGVVVCTPEKYQHCL